MRDMQLEREHAEQRLQQLQRCLAESEEGQSRVKSLFLLLMGGQLNC